MTRMRDWLDGRAATRLVQGLVVISLLIGLYLTVQQRDLAQCQARYAETAAISQSQRAQAAAEDRAALDTMVDTIVNANSPGASRAALLAYQEARRASDTRRAAHPAPAPPSRFCG